MDTLASLRTRELTRLPIRRTFIKTKLASDKKRTGEGKIESYKALLAAKGFSQSPGVEFGDLLPPLSKDTNLLLLVIFTSYFMLALEVRKNGRVHS